MYTPGVGYTHSETNSLISNFKKPLAKRSNPQEWRHKERAIVRLARELAEAVGDDLLRQLTLVPMPPSLLKSDPEYDDRVLRLLETINTEGHYDVREILHMTEELPASHSSSNRSSPFEIETAMAVADDCVRGSPEPAAFAVVDDVIGSGAHFRAASNVLKRHFGDAPVIGLFIARSDHSTGGTEEW